MTPPIRSPLRRLQAFLRRWTTRQRPHPAAAATVGISGPLDAMVAEKQAMGLYDEGARG